MFWQRDLVHFCFILEIFRKDDFIDRSPIIWLFLEALLDDHIEIFGDPLWDRLVFLLFDFFFELFDVLGVVGVLV